MCVGIYVCGGSESVCVGGMSMCGVWVCFGGIVVYVRVCLIMIPIILYNKLLVNKHFKVNT